MWKSSWRNFIQVSGSVQVWTRFEPVLQSGQPPEPEPEPEPELNFIFSSEVQARTLGSELNFNSPGIGGSCDCGRDTSSSRSRWAWLRGVQRWWLGWQRSHLLGHLLFLMKTGPVPFLVPGKLDKRVSWSINSIPLPGLKIGGGMSCVKCMQCQV